MAAQTGGTDVESISACKTRSCLIPKGAQAIKKVGNTEFFQVQKPTGSAARAAMHGVLDVATFGIWEIAGTPIETVANKKEIYIIKATYSHDGETINSLQLAQ